MGLNLSLSNKDETEFPCAIFKTACAKRGAVGMSLIFLLFFIFDMMPIESDTTRELRLEFSILSIAGSENTPCEMYACT